MADAPVVQMGESREQVAFKLLELVAGSEKVLLRGSPASGWESATREYVLDTYAECLKTVMQPFDRE